VIERCLAKPVFLFTNYVAISLPSERCAARRTSIVGVAGYRAGLVFRAAGAIVGYIWHSFGVYVMCADHRCAGCRASTGREI